MLRGGDNERAGGLNEPTAALGLARALAGVVDAADIRDDPATRALMAEDIWSAPDGDVALVVTPRSLAQLAAVMRTAPCRGRNRGTARRGDELYRQPCRDDAGRPVARLVRDEPHSVDRCRRHDGDGRAGMHLGRARRRAQAARTAHAVLGPDVGPGVDDRRRDQPAQRDARRGPLWDVERERRGAHHGARRRHHCCAPVRAGKGGDHPFLSALWPRPDGACSAAIRGRSASRGRSCCA